MIDAIMMIIIVIIWVPLIAYGVGVALAFNVYVAYKCWEIAKDIWKKMIEICKGD